MNTLSRGKAIVCFSGGQDSTTCLFWALDEFSEVKAVSVDYGQHHKRELEAQSIIAKMANVEHVVLDMPFLRQIGGGALTSEKIPFNHDHPVLQDLPSTFVPYRNLFLLSAAAALGLKLGYLNLVAGVCETDYSGYPDCRRIFIDHLEATLHQALGGVPGTRIKIHTPLMYHKKQDTVRMARAMPEAWEALAFTHTCYTNDYPPCGVCNACKLRAIGFEKVGVKDPLIERWEQEEEDNA